MAPLLIPLAGMDRASLGFSNGGVTFIRNQCLYT